MAKTRFATALWNITGLSFQKLSYFFFKLSVLFGCCQVYTEDGSIRSPRELWRYYKTCLLMNEVSKRL